MTPSQQCRRAVRRTPVHPPIGSIAPSKGMDQQPQDPARPFLEGNTTALFTDGKVVRAHSIYNAFSDEVMSVVDFMDVLRQWRDAVGAARHDGRCRPSK